MFYLVHLPQVFGTFAEMRKLSSPWRGAWNWSLNWGLLQLNPL